MINVGSHSTLIPFQISLVQRHFVGQAEPFAGKGDRPWELHCVCPDKGSCLQKVMSKCGFAHKKIRRLCRDIRTDSRGPNCVTTVDPSASSAVDHGVLNCFQEKRLADALAYRVTVQSYP